MRTLTMDMNLVGTTLGTVRRSWSADHAMLYALGVGAGAGNGGSELAYTTENTAGVPQQVLPGYASVLGFPAAAYLGSDGRAQFGDKFGDKRGAKGGPAVFGGFPASSILHGGHRLQLHRPLPVSGQADVSAVVTAVQDTGDHALVTVETELSEAGSGAALATNRAVFLVRGAGGFGGPRPTPAVWSPPPRAPDAVVSYTTCPAQGLLYRLSGDRNRMHSDPAAARKAGFDRPILHGLCTYGFAARALLHMACDGDQTLFGSLSARFTSPVVPGEQLDIQLWDKGGHVQFQVLAAGRLVLNHGQFIRQDTDKQRTDHD